MRETHRDAAHFPFQVGLAQLWGVRQQTGPQLSVLSGSVSAAGGCTPLPATGQDDLLQVTERGMKAWIFCLTRYTQEQSSLQSSLLIGPGFVGVALK